MNNNLKILVVAIAVVLVAAGGYVALNPNNAEIKKTVSFDVNPSIQMELNENNEVINIQISDGITSDVVESTKPYWNDINKTTEKIIEYLFTEEYLNSDKNSILISSSKTVPSDLLNNISGSVSNIFDENSVKPAMLTQTVKDSKDVKDATKDFNISASKASLIDGIVNADKLQTVSNLASKNINDLNLIISTNDLAIDDVEKKGVPSQSQYIGEDAAFNIALKDSGLTSSAVSKKSIDIDVENGKMVYEVEFKNNGFEYEYDVLAENGTILDKSKSVDDDTPVVPPTGDIGVEKALSIAYAEASVNPKDVVFTDIKQDFDDGIFVYEIEFGTATVEYEYNINAKTGKIIKSSTESSSVPSGGNAVDENQAKSIAFTDAGVPNTTTARISLDVDDGRSVYEIKFENTDFKFKYVVDVLTGTIIEQSSELNFGAEIPSDVITESEAISIALKDAKLSESDLVYLPYAEFEDGKIQTYEVEFETKTTEYEYTINAKTGEILDVEIDIDSDAGEDPEVPSDIIKEDAALKIALDDAKYSKDKVSDIEIDLEADVAGFMYEVEFKADNKEFTYIIDAKSGAIIVSLIDTEDTDEDEDDDDAEIDDEEDEEDDEDDE